MGIIVSCVQCLKPRNKEFFGCEHNSERGKTIYCSKLFTATANFWNMRYISSNDCCN